jgi:hypothetical protein
VPSSYVGQRDGAFTTLRQFARKRPRVECCEICGQQLALNHQHLLETQSRKLVCACDACAVLFSSQSATKYKRVPRRVLFLREFQMTDGQWDSLMIPIEMAFFFNSTPQGKIGAFYPSPAGATESLLSLDTWNDIVQTNPILEKIEPSVEALLVNRVGATRGVSAEHYIVPIDECYKLVGLIRIHWHGLSGGTEVWREVGNFFAELKQKAGLHNGESNA